MTAIAAATQSAAPPPRTAPVPAQGDAPSAGRATAPATPAVLNDVAVARSDAAELPRARADAGQVSTLLDQVSGYNAFVDIYRHGAWTAYEAKFGKEKMEATRSESLQSLQAYGAHVGSRLADAGIPVRAVPTSPGADAPSAFAIGEFSVRSAGATYEVRVGADGAMVGTQGGQPWRSWQVLPSTAGAYSGDGAPIALQALADLRTLSERTATYRQDGSGAQPSAATLLALTGERPPGRLL